MREETEIQALADKASDEVNNPSRNLSGMSYAEGVRAALEWVLNEEETSPLE